MLEFLNVLVTSSLGLTKDTHKTVFFCGRTNKSVGMVNHPYHKAKKLFFSLKSGCFRRKIGKKKKKMSESVAGYYKTKKKEEKKPLMWGGS